MSFHPMSCRLLAIALIVLVLPLIARAGDVLKTDDSLVAGDLTSFDGTNLAVQGFGATAATFHVTIPIQDIERVRFQTPAPAAPSSPLPDRSDRNFQGFVPYGNPNPTPAPAPAVSTTVLPSFWQVKLSGDDRVSGALRSWSEDQFTIDIQQGRAILQIPTPSIREIWRVVPDLVRKARDLKMTSTTDDVAYVVKDSDVVAVKGTALGVENLALRFVFDGQERKINIDRLLGVELASRKRAATSASAAAQGSTLATFSLLNGDSLTGHWTQLKDGFVSINASWDQVVQLPVTSIAAIEIHNGRVVGLSQLKPVKVEQTPYFDRIIPWRADTSLDGGPLKLNDGREYARGIAMHSRCVLEYELGGQFERFQARLGFEPMPPGAPAGRAAIRVLLDGKPLFDNPDVRGDESPRDLTLDIHGGKLLTLQVDFGKDQDAGDRVVWANARLIRASADQ